MTLRVVRYQGWLKHDRSWESKASMRDGALKKLRVCGPRPAFGFSLTSRYRVSWLMEQASGFEADR